MIKRLIRNTLRHFGYTLNRILPVDDTEARQIRLRGETIIRKISSDLTILNGPFRGMRYPSTNITEVVLAPKITGSYEKHLFPIIERISEIQYNHIIDVGSAEGYYAVGFARQHPEATVHCFDINEADMKFAKAMAELNGVQNLTYNSFCSPETLISFDYGKRSLILCDCEGYELELFTEEVIPHLRKTDVLIEMHDILNPLISETLLNRFRATHDVCVVNNSNLDYSNLNGLDELSPSDRAFAVYEHRGGLNKIIFMEWAFFTPKATP